jgi:hypothetical protein
MVICSPFRVAVTSPAANLAVWSRFGVKFSVGTAQCSPLKAIPDSAVVRSIIQIPECLWFEARSGRHHVREFGREVLRIHQQIGIQHIWRTVFPFVSRASFVSITSYDHAPKPLNFSTRRRTSIELNREWSTRFEHILHPGGMTEGEDDGLANR